MLGLFLYGIVKLKYGNDKYVVVRILKTFESFEYGVIRTKRKSCSAFLSLIFISKCNSNLADKLKAFKQK